MISPQELAEIKARCEAAFKAMFMERGGLKCYSPKWDEDKQQLIYDNRKLLAEIERLQSLVEKADEIFNPLKRDSWEQWEKAKVREEGYDLVAYHDLLEGKVGK